jgi:DNA-binding GntR family transcriptional regulator
VRVNENTNKIKQLTLSELAYKKIKSLILNNTLKPGDKLLQDGMAEEFGISKIPLIQALSLLNNEGLLEKLPRKGFFVKQFSEDEIDNIFEIRSIFEMVGVSKLTKILDVENKNKLKNFLKEFEYYYEKKMKKEYYDTDVKFHYFFIEASKNDLLISITEKFNILITGFTKGFILDWDISISQHRELINAMVKGDIQEAETLIRQHLDSIKNKYKKSENTSKK